MADPVGGPLSRLLTSLGEFLATLLSIGRTRIELLTVELQLEVRTIAQLLVWAFVGIFGAGLGLMMGGLAVIFAFWDTHRTLAAVIVTVAFFGLAAVAGIVLVIKIKTKPRLLEGTLTEIARDSEQLRSGR